jgi:hypothetical protein
LGDAPGLGRALLGQALHSAPAQGAQRALDQRREEIDDDGDDQDNQ